MPESTRANAPLVRVAPGEIGEGESPVIGALIRAPSFGGTNAAVVFQELAPRVG